MAAGFIPDIWGTTPQIAPFIPTDPIQELSTLLGGEVKDWSQITDISNLYQQYMMSALNQAIPGFSDILSQGGTDTSALLKEALPLEEGKIPQDVIDQVTRSDAFTSLMSGTAGSGMSGGLTARDLGLTSLNLMQQGAGMLDQGTNAAQRWSQIAGGTILSPQQNMYSPEWFTQFMAQQNAAKEAHKQLVLNAAATPDPAASGSFQFLGNLLGAYLGHGMGGGGGGMVPQYGSQYTGQSSVPAGGFGGTWAGITGQPYDVLGGSGGATATIGYNAPPYNPFNQG